MNEYIITFGLILFVLYVFTKEKKTITCAKMPSELYKENIPKVIKENVPPPIAVVNSEVITPPTNTIIIRPLEEQIIRINRSSMEDVYGNKKIRIIDERVNDDPLTEPVRRYPYNYYPEPPIAEVTNIMTKYRPDSFSFLGNLHREHDNKILKLYGRRRYDELWDYYIIFNTNDNLQTKVNLPTRNLRQLYDGDDVEVDIFRNGGRFKVFLNKQDEFAYSPYIY